LAQAFQIFYSTADKFSEFHSVSLNSSGTDVVLVFVDVVLLVATSVDIRDIVDTGADGFLMDLSR